jgi:hypothetical protein
VETSADQERYYTTPPMSCRVLWYRVTGSLDVVSRPGTRPRATAASRQDGRIEVEALVKRSLSSSPSIGVIPLASGGIGGRRAQSMRQVAPSEAVAARLRHDGEGRRRTLSILGEHLITGQMDTGTAARRLSR